MKVEDAKHETYHQLIATTRSTGMYVPHSWLFRKVPLAILLDIERWALHFFFCERVQNIQIIRKKMASQLIDRFSVGEAQSVAPEIRSVCNVYESNQVGAP